ncbi:LOW QUALITY PROTEIN: hypothetical protein Cgig2_022433 [Carnegiea gigantea]|uniref:Aminotransferase-like plant mobile domain-containing protein n=1 Tax=Carnegiea gigantea TaxID=171969 RepID=A0A9Q1GVH5_9CARY|nr:LOW QUALITY PROTEIN: hypothetical protein Cgig2_022433 [Carnegiea gigantea]
MNVLQLWTGGVRLVRCIMKRSGTKRQVRSSVRKGARSSHSEGPQKGSVMDEDWEMSLGSDFVPSEARTSTKDSVSLVEESGKDVGVCGSHGDVAANVDADSGNGSGEGKSRKSKRQPIVKGRQRKATGDRFVFDKDGRGMRGVVPVRVRRKCRWEKICKFNKTLKPILEYQSFSMQRELTTALVKAWVPYRKAFRLTRRLVPFCVCDASFFTSLPVMGKRVEFDEDDLCTTELTRMVRLRMAQYVTETSDKLKSEKGARSQNYIKVMKKLLDANKESEKLELWLSLYAWMVMSEVMFPRTPYRAAWSVQKYMKDVHGMGEYEQNRVWFYEHITWFVKHNKGRFPSVDHGVRYDAFELVAGIKESEVGQMFPLVIHVSHPDLAPSRGGDDVSTVRDFIKTDGLRYYLPDGEGVLSFEEHLEQACEELCAEKGKHIDTEKRLQFWMSHAKELETRLKMFEAQGKHQNAGHQLGGDVGVGVYSESGLETLVRIGNDLRQATERDSSELKAGEEDAMFLTTGHILGDSYEGQNMATRTVDAAAPPEVYVDAPKCSEPNVVPSPAVEDVGQTLSDVAVMFSGEGKVGVHEPLGETPTRYLGNLLKFADHGLSMAAQSTDVNSVDADEACVDPILGSSVESGTNPEGDTQVKPESERTMSPDADDVPCEDMRRSRRRKLVVVHGTPVTDLTRLSRARKRQ